MSEPSIAVSRDIAAPAGRIFSILVRPTSHHDEMGDYIMENCVVEFERDRRIVWEPVMRSIDKPEFQSGVDDPAHQQWGWELEPLDADHTRVVEFFDCSRSPDWLKEAVKGGEGWRGEIEASLDNLERLVAGP